MKLYINLLCTGMLLVPAYHNIRAETEESDYVTSANVKGYQPKKSSYELSDNQKIALGIAGTLAAGATAYGAYQYVTADNTTPTTTDVLRGELSNPVTMKQLTSLLNSPEYVNNPKNQQNFLNQRFPGLTENEKQGILSIADYERNNPSVLRPSQLDAMNASSTPLLSAQPLSERPAKPLPIEEFDFDI